MYLNVVTLFVIDVVTFLYLLLLFFVVFLLCVAARIRNLWIWFGDFASLLIYVGVLLIDWCSILLCWSCPFCAWPRRKFAQMHWPTIGLGNHG